MNWRFLVGNLVSRAATFPVAVSPSVEDSGMTLDKLGCGYPDQASSFQWRPDGQYAVDLPTNMLESSSSRVDAPTGWSDLLLLLARTPGLPANPPDHGTYDSRAALRFYWPVVQAREVMPGERVRLAKGIQWPSSASGATGVRLRVVDRWSGKGWNGSAWVASGVLAEQTTPNAWMDVDTIITADPNRTELSEYWIMIEPIAASFGATTFCYASTLQFQGEVQVAAVIGHNLPDDAVVTLTPAGGSPIPMTPVQPSFYALASGFAATWRLSIVMPSGIAPSPILMEAWLGSVAELLRSPMGPLNWKTGDPTQMRMEAGRRVEVIADDSRPVDTHELTFKVPSLAAYEQMRNGLLSLTRFGKDPVLLIPDTFLREAPIHGRVGAEVSFVQEETLPEPVIAFSVEFRESPFAG